MKMRPGLRKLVLATHLTSSVGWIGAVIAFLALVGLAWTSPDTAVLRGAWIAMDVIGWWVLVPMAAMSLITGLVLSLGTNWGLLRRYWIVISLVLTVLATGVLTSNMQTVRFFAQMAADATQADVAALREGLRGELLHAGVGLFVLLVIQVLNIYKPRGMTPYGLRKQAEERSSAQRSRDKRRELPV